VNFSFEEKGLNLITILRLHVTSSPPCWKTITKDLSLASFVYGTNMAAMSLSLDSLGNDCKPRIVIPLKYSLELSG
jgi:hypothetical protein